MWIQNRIVSVVAIPYVFPPLLRNVHKRDTYKHYLANIAYINKFHGYEPIVIYMVPNCKMMMMQDQLAILIYVRIYV